MRPLPAPGRLAFRLALAAVALHLLVSSNLLLALGISYNVPGGLPPAKFHPASYLIALAAAVRMRDQGGLASGVQRLLHDAPSYAGCVLAMLICALFTVASTGTMRAAVFIENYVSACLLAYVLEDASGQERRALGLTALALCLANVAFASGEALLHAHLVPPYVAGEPFIEAPGDFRGIALYDHPLTGAAITMLCLVALQGMGLRPLGAAACFGMLSLGLLVFGGRAALAIGAAAIGTGAAMAIMGGLVTRRLGGRLLRGVALAMVVLPVASLLLVTLTPIGERLAAHLYIDSSVAGRTMQWTVLQRLDLREALFGMPEDRVPDLVFLLGLDAPFTDIENPWLLTYLKLGAVGSLVFLAGLLPFFARLWRLSTAPGRLLLCCGLLVVSSNNSLGRKSNMLFVVTAFIVTSAGFGTPRPNLRPTYTAFAARGTV